MIFKIRYNVKKDTTASNDFNSGVLVKYHSEEEQTVHNILSWNGI